MRTALIGGAVAGLLGWSLLVGGVSFAQAGDSAQAIKAATAAQITKTENLVLDHIEVRRVMGDFAWAVAYPNLKVNETDPATVILQKVNGTWTAIAGPGTAFMPAEDFPQAPQGLYDFSNPYTDEAATTAIGRVPGPHKVYSSQGLSFQYAANATVQAADGSAVRLVGPTSTSPQFAGPSYDVTVQRLPEAVNGPLDEWGYARVLQQTPAHRDAEGDTRTFGAESATFFHIGSNDVYQIDWFAGDSVLRELYVAPQGGGSIIELQTRVYPVENNPAAPQAEGAVALLLNTLKLGATGPTPGMPSTGAGAGAWPALLALPLALAALGLLLRRRASCLRIG